MIDPPSSPASDGTSSAARYWRTNLRYLAVLLTIWFAVSYGAGILFVDVLDRFTVPGTSFPLGFWFAQQGSIYVFVVLIFVYVWLMNRLDRRHGVDEGEDPAGHPTDAGRDSPTSERRAGEPEAGT